MTFWMEQGQVVGVANVETTAPALARIPVTTENLEIGSKYVDILLLSEALSDLVDW